MRRSPTALVAIALFTIAAVGCGGDSSEGDAIGLPDGSITIVANPTGPAPGTPRPDTSDAFGWAPFGEDLEGVEAGSIEVPIDYDDPSAGTFDLYIARHVATDPAQRIGSLLVNPGGPGFGGSDWAILAASNYGRALLEHFDIVGWDPRGTGQSLPAIDCTDDYDRYHADVDITPDDSAERQTIIDLADEFQTECVQQNAAIIQHVGTNDSARDIDTIRQALGEDQITYFGFSYGSELGATWMTLFPDTVRAAVLDGAIDPNADLDTASLQQAAGFEQSLTSFLAACSANDQCPFHNSGDAEGAFDRLMASLDASPLPSADGRPAVNLGVALSGTTQAMYGQTRWPALEQALADAQAGDGAGLLALYDESYLRRLDGTYPNVFEAFQTILCMDRTERPTVVQDDALAVELHRVSPRLSPSTVGSYQCTFFPTSDDPRLAITGDGAGPALVVGTTGDPATPLASSQAMADALDDAVLLTVESQQHTGYSANDCSIEVIDNFLVNLIRPAEGTRCE
jgi:pimeloyl-ACP methyl ester carboxylesterase